MTPLTTLLRLAFLVPYSIFSASAALLLTYQVPCSHSHMPTTISVKPLTPYANPSLVYVVPCGVAIKSIVSHAVLTSGQSAQAPVYHGPPLKPQLQSIYGLQCWGALQFDVIVYCHDYSGLTCGLGSDDGALCCYLLALVLYPGVLEELLSG